MVIEVRHLMLLLYEMCYDDFELRHVRGIPPVHPYCMRLCTDNM